MSAAPAPLRILHCHSTFALGGKEARAVRLMNAFGGAAQHSILSATDDLAARDAIAPGISIDFPADAPSLTGKPGWRRYAALARYMAGFDLVLTYNWGSMDVPAAHRLMRVNTPLIHHEDGFNADEAVRLNPKRNLYRRLMLGSAQAVVVPSHRLETIARDVWGQGNRVRRIANGIETQSYAAPATPGSIPGFERAPGDVVVGTLAGLRAVKNLPRLVRAVATLPQHVRLVIIGEGPERGAILAAAAQCGMADRLLLPGFHNNPAAVVPHFDIFALSSDSEQQPISLIEAMAAAKPVAALGVGDVPMMVAEPNRRFIADDEAGLAAALAALAGDAALRAELGTANQAHARAHFDEAGMIGSYAALYAGAMGVPSTRLWAPAA